MMLKRVTWFAVGAVAGAASSVVAGRRVKAKAAELAPSQVARRTVVRVREAGRTMSDAVREGRVAMRTKEAELLGRRDGVVTPLHPSPPPGTVTYVVVTPEALAQLPGITAVGELGTGTTGQRTGRRRTR